MAVRQTIAIDIDDTIADSTEALRIDINKRAGVNIPAEAYRVPGQYWGYYERVWQTHGVADRVNFQEHLEDMAIDQSLVPLLPGAAFAITQLAKRYDILLITSRDKRWEQATRAWFRTHFGDFDVKLYFTNSHRDASELSKGQLCKQLGATLLIDDSVDHCNGALAEGVSAILFGTYGWHAADETEAIKCRDWPAVLEYVDGR